MGAFTNLLNEENLERIQIDEKLVQAFKNVMKKLQSYFDANDYNELKNYEEFFEKHLLLPKESESIKHDLIGYRQNGVYHKGFTIELNDEPSKKGAAGLYQRKNNRICIDQKYVGNTEYLEGIICHEFIHFIVMHDLEKAKSSEEIINGGFINEALTQMLTEHIYPNIKAYIPQTSMLKYANILMNNTNNYSSFLKGWYSVLGSSWFNFIIQANQYQQKFKDVGFHSSTMQDESFINAQRYLICMALQGKHGMNIDEYMQLTLKIISNIPTTDNEWLDKKFIDLDRDFICSIFHVSEDIKTVLQGKLSELRQKYIELSIIDNAKNYTKTISCCGHSFEIEKMHNCKYKVTINSSVHFEIDGSVAKAVDIPTKSGKKLLIISLDVDRDELNFNLKEGEFSKKLNTTDLTFIDKEKLHLEKIKEIDDLTLLFNQRRTTGLYKLLDFFIKKNMEVLNIEQYHIPNYKATKSHSYYFYLADVIKDGVPQKILLNSWFNTPIVLGTINNCDLNQVIGLGRDDSRGLWTKNICKVNKGYVYSASNEEAINAKIYNKFRSIIEKSVTSEIITANLSRINLDELTIGLNKSKIQQQIKEEIIDLLINDEIKKLSSEEFKELRNNIIDTFNDKVVLYQRDSKWFVGKYFLDSTILEVESMTIYGNGLRTPTTEIIEQILKEKENCKVR